MTDPARLRNLVGQWLRIRAEHPRTDWSHPHVSDSAVFRQLAADAEHSDLLLRLFSGEEPLAYEDWLTRP